MFRALATCVLCLLAVPRMAAAEWHITPMIGVTFAGRTTLVDPQHAADERHVDFGGAVTLLGAGVLGAEAVITFTPGFFQANQSPLSMDVAPPELKSSHVLAVMGNAVLTTPRRGTEDGLPPPLSGGLGRVHPAQGPGVDPGPSVHPRQARFKRR